MTTKQTLRLGVAQQSMDLRDTPWPPPPSYRDRVRLPVRDLATPRYAALTLLMVLVALICVAAGTWQVSRYDGKHLANDDLRRNAADTVTPVAGVLPLVGSGRTPDADSVEFRAVTATGTYDTAQQVLVRLQQVDDRNGYTVVTPLRTDAGPVLLVARGFVADDTATLSPAAVPAPPAGPVAITARTQASDTGDDKFAALGNGQVETVNASSTAARLGTEVYAGYVELDADQPGTAGLTALPAPDLSNPAGGAFEWQHLAYIVQWYLFALLALAAPFVMVRVDQNRARDDAATVEAHLAAIGPAGTGRSAALTSGDSSGAELVHRSDGAVVVAPGDAEAYDDHVKATSARLAERYGR